MNRSAPLRAFPRVRNLDVVRIHPFGCFQGSSTEVDGAPKGACAELQRGVK